MSIEGGFLAFFSILLFDDIMFVASLHELLFNINLDS